MEIIKILGFESRRFPGTMDHGKFWSTLVLVWLIGMCTVYETKLTVAMAIVIGSLSFGRSMWTRFLESKAVTAHSAESVSEQHSTTTNILKNYPRDYEDGTQPWPGPSEESGS